MQRIPVPSIVIVIALATSMTLTIATNAQAQTCRLRDADAYRAQAKAGATQRRDLALEYCENQKRRLHMDSHEAAMCDAEQHKIVEALKQAEATQDLDFAFEGCRGPSK